MERWGSRGKEGEKESKEKKRWGGMGGERGQEREREESRGGRDLAWLRERVNLILRAPSLVLFPALQHEAVVVVVGECTLSAVGSQDEISHLFLPGEPQNRKRESARARARETCSGLGLLAGCHATLRTLRMMVRASIINFFLARSFAGRLHR